MAQWADLINEAIMDIGALAAGQTISTSAQNDAFLRLQQMLANWSMDQLLAIYQIQHGSFVLQNGVNTYFLGIGQIWNTVFNPVRITSASSISGNFRKNMRLLSFDEFDREVSDDVGSTAILPEIMAVDRAFPNITVRVWRIPIGGAFQEIQYWIPMTPPVNVTDTVNTPPEFQMAIQKNLAVALYPEYARERGVDPMLVKVAADSLETIRGVNRAMFGEGLPAQPKPTPPSAG